MPIEQSHGKARATLPRARELPSSIPIPAAPIEAPASRGAHGQFAPGNTIAAGRGLRLAVRRMLGRADETNETVAGVAMDAHRIYSAALATLPNDSAPVQQLVALHARHSALASYFSGRAAELGLESEQAIAIGALAIKHGERSERTLVTAIDVATRLSKATPAPLDLDAINAEAERATQGRRDAVGVTR